MGRKPSREVRSGTPAYRKAYLLDRYKLGICRSCPRSRDSAYADCAACREKSKRRDNERYHLKMARLWAGWGI